MIRKFAFTLLLCLLATMGLNAQTSCPAGSLPALGYVSVDPATGNRIFPICIEQSTGRFVFQAVGLSLVAGQDLVFEGTTDDAFETTVTVTDPTTPDKTVTIADASGTVFLSSLATNAPDVANSIWGASNSLVFEGLTADDFEASIAPADVGQDVVATIPDAASGAFNFGHTTATIYLGAAALHVDGIFFIADRAYLVTDIDAVWGTAESTGAMDIQVERLQATEACTGGAGDNLLSAVIDATGAANTVNNGTLAGAGVTALAAGDRLCLNLTATPNEITNMVVTVGLDPN
jgi:hypothetical protein